MGYIKVFTGPMKCGKTNKLIEQYNKLKEDYKCLVFKPEIDNRFSENNIVDRNGNSVPAINITKIDEILRYNFMCDIFFIDEFQFLTGDYKALLEFKDKNKKFFISGLNMTSDREPFGLMCNLLCIADEIEILKANCDICGSKEGIYTYCKIVKDKILVGDEPYLSVCEDCYKKLNRRSTMQ